MISLFIVFGYRVSKSSFRFICAICCCCCCIFFKTLNRNTSIIASSPIYHGGEIKKKSAESNCIGTTLLHLIWMWRICVSVCKPLIYLMKSYRIKQKTPATDVLNPQRNKEYFFLFTVLLVRIGPFISQMLLHTANLRQYTHWLSYEKNEFTYENGKSTRHKIEER